MFLMRRMMLMASFFCLSSTVIAADCGMKTHHVASGAAQGNSATISQQQQNVFSGATERVKVNINTATLNDLVNINGLNLAKAKSIISYRKKHGDFTSLDDLKSVRGFKKMDEASLKQIQDQMRLQ